MLALKENKGLKLVISASKLRANKNKMKCNLKTERNKPKTSRRRQILMSQTHSGLLISKTVK